MISNEAGWGLGTDGEWYSPLVDVDGEWVERTDVEWAPDPEPPAPLEPLQDHHLPTDETITDGDLRLTVVEPWRIDENDHVWVRVMATQVSTGDLLDVDDGNFVFVNAHAAIDVQADLVTTCHRMTGI